MSLAAIEARARSKAGQADPRLRARRYAASESARRLANLKADGFVIPFSQWLGHNNGPAWDEWARFVEYCWKRAHAAVWKPPTWEIGVRRAKRAAELGISYRQYALEIMERGRYLDEETAQQLREETKAKRSCSQP